jgi:ferredoxin
MRKYLLLLSALLVLNITGCDATKTGDVSIVVNKDKCISCGKCEEVCPFKAVRLVGSDNKAVIDPDKCIQCGDCIEVCPEKAISGGN